MSPVTQANCRLNFTRDETAACMRLIDLAIAEDLSDAGDLTSNALVPATLPGAARCVARTRGVLAGFQAAALVLNQLDRNLRIEAQKNDGDRLEVADTIARVAGPLRSLLAAERICLNFMQRLSGIASATRQYVDAVAGLPCQILDTRKTAPGWRLLEKHAVRAGGGGNHRIGLFDAVLIKDNHLVAWKTAAGKVDLSEVVRAARQAVPAGSIELEVDSIEQLEQSLAGRPDIVLLDNMTAEQHRQAVAIRNARAPHVLLEASGGITLGTVRQIAESGVDRISIGAITHSAPALDIALDFEEPPP